MSKDAFLIAALLLIVAISVCVALFGDQFNGYFWRGGRGESPLFFDNTTCKTYGGEWVLEGECEVGSHSSILDLFRSD